MELTLKNVKVHAEMSDETTCFSASVYVDGERAGSVSNRGGGGPHEIDWCSDKNGSEWLGLAYEEWLKNEVILCEDPTDPEKTMVVGEFYSKLDWKIDEALEAFLDKKWFKGQCRSQTLFQLKGDGGNGDSWRIVKSPFNPEIKTWLVNRFGDDLGEIANETRI